MSKKIGRFFITLFGLMLGFGLVLLVFKNKSDLGIASYLDSLRSWVRILIYAVSTVLFGIIFFLLSPAIINGVVKMIRKIERRTSEMSMGQIFVGVIGLLIGLLIAVLLSLLVQKIPFKSVVILLDVILFVSLAYLGFKIPTSRIKEFNLPNWFKKSSDNQADISVKAKPKLLDTSAIIDGRFFDVYRTGVIEGNIVVPQFVLDELRHIADSADPLKRARGRRGLDAINELQESIPEKVIVSTTDYPELDEVDTKLLRLSGDMGGIVVTNDYNLGKVAQVQSVPVFNINDLSNALRINVVAGEVVELTVVKEGKEHGQGVAYFDDGTMVVIDGAAKLVGKTIPATVTSVLQTSAGRMVFAKAEVE